MRFCMLTTFYPPNHFGGDAIGIQRLTHALARRGHEVTVVHDVDAHRLLAKGPPSAPIEHPAGVRAIGLRSRFPLASELATQQLGRPVAHRRRIAEVLAEGFDVINYHNASLVGGPGLFEMGEGVKLYLAHEHWLICPMHVLWRHGRELCTGRECFRCTLNHRRPPQLWRWTGLLERAGRHVDRFVAMSEFSRAKHAEFGFPFEMEVLPYFLPDPTPEEEAAVQPASPSPHERPYFLFVGRLERIKGLDDVIPLFERYGDADLLIAGEGNHGPVLRGLARHAPGVRFLGRVAPEELRRYYDHALALIVPSVCFETFGIILIEAFRQRTPVIARRIGPFPEIVRRADAGFLFENDEELMSAMESIRNDSALRARLADNAWSAYRDHWSESAVVPRYLDLVERARAPKTPPSSA